MRPAKATSGRETTRRLENANDLELAALRHIIAMADKPDKNGDRFICKYRDDELVLRPIPIDPLEGIETMDSVSANLKELRRVLQNQDDIEFSLIEEVLVVMHASIQDIWDRLKKVEKQNA